MFLRKKHRVVSIDLTDYAIRALVSPDDDITTAFVYEFALPPQMIVDETVVDDLAFFNLMKELVKDWKIANYDLRLFTQEHAVMMRTFEHPEDLEPDRLNEYVEMELGQSIHLPFDRPLIDIYDHDAGDGEATIFAVPSEDAVKLIHLYEDVRLHPHVLEVKALANLRFLANISYFSPGKTYLVADWSIHAVTISIYSGGDVEFLRYQAAEQLANNWKFEANRTGENVYTYEGNLDDYFQMLSGQVFEIERVLDFYRFSLNKGEKFVDEIVVLGGHPELEAITDQMRTMIETPIIVMNDEYVQKFYPQFEAKDVALIGLALKGGSHGS